jgi:hypothetical protein
MIMSSNPIDSTLRIRASLLFRLRDWKDKKSWEEFYELYRRQVQGFARRLGLILSKLAPTRPAIRRVDFQT